MEEVATNLAEVSADFVSLWSVEQQRHTNIRELFVSSEAVTRAQRVQVQVGEETDELLAYEAPSNDQVPALVDLLDYIEQERLGAGTVVNKYFTVNRKNMAQEPWLKRYKPVRAGFPADCLAACSSARDSPGSTRRNRGPCIAFGLHISKLVAGQTVLVLNTYRGRC
jgi:hypothetical protein